MSLKRFGVSLEDNLLESLDQYVNENGFANRSQAIRFLVEKNVAEKKWQCNHIVAGTIILMYDQVKRRLLPDCRYSTKLSGCYLVLFPILCEPEFLSAHRNCDGYGLSFDRTVGPADYDKGT